MYVELGYWQVGYVEETPVFADEAPTHIVVSAPDERIGVPTATPEPPVLG